MSKQPIHTHSNCNDNPKGFLRRLTVSNGNGSGIQGNITQYYICDCCKIVVMMQQVELKC
jgi:hypothetical protein